MLLSTAIQKWKAKGISKVAALEKAKAALKKISKRWTKAQQEVFDTAWKKRVAKAPAKEKKVVAEKPAITKKPIKNVKTDVAPKKVKLIKKTEEPPEGKPVKVAKSPEPKEDAVPSRGDEEALKLKYAKFAAMGDKKAQSKLDFLAKDLWPYLNKLYFHNKLPKAVWSFTRDTGQGFRRRACYQQGRNEFSFSTRTFLAPYEEFRELCVHEMCHQAARKIDGATYKTAREAHGTIWCNWMRRCGVNPSRFDKNHNDVYMTEEEREHHVEKKEAKKEAEKTEKPFYTLMAHQLPAAAKYFDPEKKTWHTGMVVTRNDEAGKRFIFITIPDSSRWKIVPRSWLYQVEETEATRIKTEAMLSAARNIVGYKKDKKEIRTMRRNTRKGILW